jgi:hypothetical protein
VWPEASTVLAFHKASCRNLTIIYVLVSTVVRRFSIVPICSKILFIIFLSPVLCWSADELELCVVLALYLYENRNFFFI